MSPASLSPERSAAQQAIPGQGAELPKIEKPKIERHYPSRREHHTNTGVRQVGVYQMHEHGLYVARAFAQHPRIRAWQAHLLPALGLQVCRYDFHGEREHDYYIDLASIVRRGEVWEMHDHYLDILLWDGVGAQLIDADELQAAERVGYVAPDLTRRVSAQAAHLLSDLKSYDFRLDACLAAQGVTLSWQSLSWLDAAPRTACEV
jgi:uncharacterized protein